jgi:hypothetical protein
MRAYEIASADGIEAVHLALRPLKRQRVAWAMRCGRGR